MPNYRRFFIDGYKYVFITVVTQNRIKILSDNIELLREAFKNALNKYNFEIFAVSVLNDHFHVILKLQNIEDFPKIIYSIKNFVSRRIDKSFLLNNDRLSPSKQKRKEKGIWQRRYWDHIIRNEIDLNTHIDYIHYNPVKHGYSLSPIDYKFSSFQKFVNLGLYEIDWCNLGDYNNINQLDFE